MWMRQGAELDPQRNVQNPSFIRVDQGRTASPELPTAHALRMHYALKDRRARRFPRLPPASLTYPRRMAVRVGGLWPGSGQEHVERRPAAAAGRRHGQRLAVAEHPAGSRDIRPGFRGWRSGGGGLGLPCHQTTRAEARGLPLAAPLLYWRGWREKIQASCCSPEPYMAADTRSSRTQPSPRLPREVSSSSAVNTADARRGRRRRISDGEGRERGRSWIEVGWSGRGCGFLVCGKELDGAGDA
jgi:hypothetical protein